MSSPTVIIGAGVGGLTIIQVMKYPSTKMLELTTTGKQGEDPNTGRDRQWWAGS